MTDDESYARWWSQRFAGFLGIEKKVMHFNDLLFLRSGKCRSNLSMQFQADPCRMFGLSETAPPRCHRSFLITTDQDPPKKQHGP